MIDPVLTTVEGLFDQEGLLKPPSLALDVVPLGLGPAVTERPLQLPLLCPVQVVRGALGGSRGDPGLHRSGGALDDLLLSIFVELLKDGHGSSTHD